MRFVFGLLSALIFLPVAFAQAAPTSATVPITLDHNRIIIDVYFPMPDGTKTRVRGWVDNGNADMLITQPLAQKLGLEISAETSDPKSAKVRTAPPPREFLIGDMAIHANSVKETTVMLDRKTIGPGLSAEVNIPSTVLRNYDVVVDYPNREFTIAAPGTIHPSGTAVKAILNPQNGLLQIPAKIGDEEHNLGFDVGASFSLLFSDVLAKLQKAHPAWPHMTGAVGSANMWGFDDEAHMELLRVPEVQYGGIRLDGLGLGSLPEVASDWFQKRAGVPTAGLIGANALLRYRIGIDYAHSAVYFDQTSKASAPDMDVVGLTLRPELDKRYTVIGVADYEGKPSVPDVRAGDVLVSIDKVPAAGGTMGQVWSLLGGSPGEIRALTLERDGKQFTMNATVRRFLAAMPTGRAKTSKKKLSSETSPPSWFTTALSCSASSKGVEAQSAPTYR